MCRIKRLAATNLFHFLNNFFHFNNFFFNNHFRTVQSFFISYVRHWFRLFLQVLLRPLCAFRSHIWILLSYCNSLHCFAVSLSSSHTLMCIPVTYMDSSFLLMMHALESPCCGSDLVVYFITIWLNLWKLKTLNIYDIIF